MRPCGRAVVVVVLLAAAGCEPGAQAPAPAPSSAAPVAFPSASAQGAESAPAAPSGAPAAVASAPPAPSSASGAASTAAVASTALAAASTAPAAASSPLPAVKVANIGIHIGGGPYDDEAKAPIAKSVSPHLDDVRACWTQVKDPGKGGDFGVDLLVPADGGKARVTNPRTSLGPTAFRDCVLHVFEEIDFAKPRRGLTMASYSLRFTP
jgi:hypothetical protein